MIPILDHSLDVSISGANTITADQRPDHGLSLFRKSLSMERYRYVLSSVSDDSIKPCKERRKKAKLSPETLRQADITFDAHIVAPSIDLPRNAENLRSSLLDFCRILNQSKKVFRWQTTAW